MRSSVFTIARSRFVHQPFRYQLPRQPLRSASIMSSASEYNIENTDVKTGPGVTLDDRSKLLVGSVLDLFAGRPSLKKLSLWTDDAMFEDPIAKAQGRKEYEAQWYGLETAFSEIERLSHEVTSGGNPIELDMTTRYVVKSINAEKTISSKINIFHENGKITKVQDKWNGQLPEGAIKDAFRRLNAVSMPKLVSVPKNDAEDAKRGNQ